MTNRRSTLGAGMIAAAMIVVAGCSTTDEGAPEQQPIGPPVTLPPGADAGPTLTDAELSARLLTPAELPVGFVEAPTAEDLGLPPVDDTSDTDQSSTDPAQCADVLAPVAEQTTGATGSAETTFTGPNFSSIDEDVAAYPDHATTAGAFEAVQSTLSECTEYRGTDVDGVEVTYSTGGREQRPVGDASTSYRVVTRSEGFSLTSDVALVVVGNVVVQLVATGQSPIDPGVFTDMTEAAVNKLAQPPA